MNPSNGQIKVSPADGQNFQLIKGDITSDLNECKIIFTVQANRVPNHDTYRTRRTLRPTRT
ncbi:hypothetical protein BH23ACT12_BH23ACT12_15690 [soil metagenome]